jgi:signal transduction histidine kinase
MWPTGYVPRWPDADNPGSAPADPAMTTLRSVIALIAAVTRSVGAAYVIVQAFIWHAFYTADPWRLAGPAVAVAWAIAVVAGLRRRRWPGWQFACADSGFYVALALSAEWCVPPATRGEAANWLVIVMASQLIVPVWFAPGVLSVPLALASPVAYWAGVHGLPAAGAGVNSPGASGALLIVAAAVHWCARRMFYGLATGADAALAQADQDAREQYVVLSRHIERREHERLLHDTVLNTLTALSRAGTGDMAEVVRRCRHDVARMESALSDPGDPDGEVAPPYGGLLGGIEAIAGEMRGRGLDVHVQAAGGVPAGTGVPGGNGRLAASADVLVVPDLVTTAIIYAAREALANVAAHAGTGEAWVTVSLGGGGSGTAPDGLQVTIRDAGAGFDATSVDRARLGVRRSITERIADCGGRASVCSAPGAGTVVRLRWPAAAHPGDTVPACGASHPGSQPW